MSLAFAKSVWSQRLVIIILAISSTSSAQYRCPLRTCPDCLPFEIHDAPGIGFDLGVSYGTAAVNEYDGTITNVAKIPASEAYLEIMARFANLSFTGSSEPEGLSQKTALSARKPLAHSTTHNIDILAGMIDELRKATLQAFPSFAIDRVVLTSPLLPALSQKDLNDALELVGLRSWLIYNIPFPKRLSESRAIFAAHGDGLCTNYQHLYRCKEEEKNFPLYVVYSVTFTYHALYVSLDEFRSPFGMTSKKEIFLLDFQADLGCLANFQTPDEYWQYVQVQLRRIRIQSGTRITKLQLAGDSVRDPTFLKTLKDALAGDLEPSSEVGNDVYRQVATTTLVDPIFTAARGAALYARRRQEVPYNCAEPTHCKEQREKERKRYPPAKQELR